MKKIILKEADIKKLKPIVDFNRGSYGSCYDYDGKVLKVFKKNIDTHMLANIKKNIKRENEFIMYPIDLIKIKERESAINGYICNKAPGVDLNDLDTLICDGKTDITFDDFLAAYYDRFLPSIKKEKLLFSDIKPRHIFYDDNFYLIDTDFYITKFPYLSNKRKDEKNLIIINESIRIFMNYFLTFGLVFDIDDIHSEKYLDNKISILRKIVGNDINTFGKLDNYIFTDDKIESIGCKI